MIDLDRLEQIAKAAPQGQWQIHTSNSWRRVYADQGRDKVRVIEPAAHSDGCPDLMFGPGIEAWLENFTPEVALGLVAEMRRLREANQELHRRAQQVEAPAQSYKAQLAYLRDSYLDMWHREFQRLIESHNEIKRIFHELARVYEYPMDGHFLHSVMDSNVEKCREPKHEGVWANCFLSKSGGLQSFRVLDEVRRAVDELIATRSKEKA